MPELLEAPVSVRSPATSANLGPGFDSFGLALTRYDEVVAQPVPDGLEIDIDGEGADDVGRDESHLVVRAIRETFDELGVAQPGLRLRCRNTIPHGRGLGSSASAIVSGIRLADAMLGGDAVSAELALTVATRIEGHPDNVAACLAGGFTIAWCDDDQTPHAVRLDVHLDVRPVLFIAPGRLSTAQARSLLPTDVTHGVASANAGRAGLLVAALTRVPEQLLAATQDRLHQEYRRPAMPGSLELVDRLRAAGIAAAVSGAGPSVLALGSAAHPIDVARWTPQAWIGTDVTVSNTGACIQ